MKQALCLIVACCLISVADATYADKFNKMQELLRTAEDMLGTGNYECYSNGECVMEYKVGELVTFRERAACASSEEGCGISKTDRAKREVFCTNLEEDYEQRCKRSEDAECSFMMQNMEEMQCQVLKREKRAIEKRQECGALQRNFEQECNGKRRAISDGCQFVMERVDELDCKLALEKRSGRCEEGWAPRGRNCYKYFTGPYNFNKALKFCEDLTNDKTSHLATLERGVNQTPEDRAFYNSLIESSGAVDKIDTVLLAPPMPSHYNNGDWKDVITYYDNWAWIGIKNVNNIWRWVSPLKNPPDWNSVTFGQPDWVKLAGFTQPSDPDPTAPSMDYGNCVTYFQHEDAADNDVGGWWNVNCGVHLPFLCEKNQD